jgi:RimJ/RimL family protein N-acetyltransferase
MIFFPEVIQTKRLQLRKPHPEDADVVFTTYVQDPEVTRYLTWRPDQTLEGTRSYIERALKAWENGTAATWTITLGETGEIIGMIDVRMEWQANLGYVLARKYWNNGYMTEAVRAVVDWAIGQEEISRVWAVCDIENVASARVLEKAGMECEGILHRWIVLPNRSTTPRDCYCYAKVK